jgi:hypothetical protein
MMIGKMKRFLKRKLRKFLELDKLEHNVVRAENNIDVLQERTENLFNMGVDVHFKSDHMILIYSKLNGGQIRHIDVDVKDMRHLKHICDSLKSAYGIRQTFYDVPYGVDKNWLEF